MVPAGLIPKGYEWCVAGGYAACPALAQDIDVWVWGVATDDLETVRARLVQHLFDTYTLSKVQSGTDTRKAPNYSQPTQITILKVAEVKDVQFSFGGYTTTKPIQIMVTDAASPEQILFGFDISTHQIAIMPDGVVWKGANWTAPHVPPVKLLDTAKTEERMQRIAARFGHTPAPVVEDVPF